MTGRTLPGKYEPAGVGLIANDHYFFASFLLLSDAAWNAAIASSRVAISVAAAMALEGEQRASARVGGADDVIQ
jgi:hypothetical protein